MPKKYYPGGFRLTKKTAAALAVRELGTARGLEREPGMPEGYFHITFGNLDVRIFPDASDSSHRSSSRLIQMSIDLNGGPARIVQFFYPDTLELCPAEEDIYRRAKGREALENWIEREGVEKCRRTVEEKVNHGIGADFSRTCEGCGCITVETVAGLPPLFRCNAPGQRRGYTVSAAGRFLPYVPAWCPLMETNK